MLNYTDTPAHYLYCLVSPAKCQKAATCLRSLAAQCLKEAPTSQQQIQTLSPYYIDKITSADKCEYYRNNQLVRFAKGMSHLFDELPHAIYHSVRHAVINCFSCESFFYQSQRGKRLISPDEQEKIKKVFQEHAPQLCPKYDDFIEKYNW